MNERKNECLKGSKREVNEINEVDQNIQFYMKKKIIIKKFRLGSLHWEKLIIRHFEGKGK